MTDYYLARFVMGGLKHGSIRGYSLTTMSPLQGGDDGQIAEHRVDLSEMWVRTFCGEGY
jgi:hypothetical protein